MYFPLGAELFDRLGLFDAGDTTRQARGGTYCEG
jgi:hypothetical protein